MQAGVKTDSARLEDLDWSPACESENEAHIDLAAHDATHAVTMTCGCTMLVCDQAVANARRYELADGHALECLGCRVMPIYISSITRLKP